MMKSKIVKKLTRLIPLLVVVTLAQGLIGCGVTNPVTGEKELGLVSRDQEIAIGAKQYAPSRQQQGGDFTLDAALTRYVKSVGAKLAKVADRDLPYEFTVINDSTPNAWALPGGKIAINRGLLTELNSEAELAAVLGHEIVHAAARHGAHGVERGAMLSGALIATSILLGGSEYRNLAMQGAQIGASAVNQKYGRDAEREADFYGIKYMVRAGYDPNASVELQETFVRLNESRQQNWLSGLFASHPPSQERVQNNKKAVAQLSNPPKYRGTKTYKRRLAYLRRVEPAYEAYDDGRKALKKGDVSKARALADKAISIEPRESLFHALKADTKIARDDYRGALQGYNTAIRRNPTYFRNYLMRGLLKEELGDRNGAANDLKKSYNLLPTKTARDRLVRMNVRP